MLMPLLVAELSVLPTTFRLLGAQGWLLPAINTVLNSLTLLTAIFLITKALRHSLEAGELSSSHQGNGLCAKQAVLALLPGLPLPGS